MLRGNTQACLLRESANNDTNWKSQHCMGF